jgi:hypothetical protein
VVVLGFLRGVGEAPPGSIEAWGCRRLGWNQGETVEGVSFLFLSYLFWSIESAGPCEERMLFGKGGREDGWTRKKDKETNLSLCRLEESLC